MEFKTIELKESIFANNDREADRLRADLRRRRRARWRRKAAA